MVALTSIPTQVAMGARLLAGLPRFLCEAPQEDSRTVIERGLRERSRIFLELVRRGIFEHERSPYLPLLRRAGITHDTCTQLVDAHGIEGMLDRLYDAGVRVTLDEFKGRQPIRRGELVVPSDARSFDNPLLARHFEARTGGSRSAGTRFFFDLDLLRHDAHYDVLFLEMFGLGARPGALWHPGPPGCAGLSWALRFASLGRPLERWFSQTPVSFRHNARHAALTQGIVWVSRLSGRPVPRPEHVRLADAVKVARWLADRRAGGTPAWMSTTASCAVRVCLAARDHGLDISGTFFRCSGEPLSPGKARVVNDAGCVARCHFAMAELGRMALACGRPSTYDDVHIAADKVAFLQRGIDLAGGATVQGLVLTTLVWSVPKIMLNVEIGDYAVKGRRSCGCVLEGLGFTEQLSRIRSYEKLTSEGMHFVGTDLLAIVDEVLPQRFGGAPTDYQFVEEERDGLPAVSLVVSEKIGTLSAGDVQSAVLNALASHDATHRMMAGLWRDGGTLRVVRREPYATNAGKILALHIEKSDSR